MRTTKVFRVKPYFLLIALFRNEAYGQCELYGSHIVQVTSNSLILILPQINMRIDVTALQKTFYKKKISIFFAFVGTKVYLL